LGLLPALVGEVDAVGRGTPASGEGRRAAYRWRGGASARIVRCARWA